MTTLVQSRSRPLAPQQIGWPMSPDLADGALGYPGLEDSIRDQIKVILLTRPGELLLHPTFGAGLEDLLHEPNNMTTRRRIRDLIATSVGRWEPRILLDAIEVWELPDRPDAVRVELAYRIRRTGSAQQFHFDLALGS